MRNDVVFVSVSKVVELQELLQTLGLPKSGKKADLQARAAAALGLATSGKAAEEQPTAAAAATRASAKDAPDAAPKASKKSPKPLVQPEPEQELSGEEALARSAQQASTSGRETSAPASARTRSPGIKTRTLITKSPTSEPAEGSQKLPPALKKPGQARSMGVEEGAPQPAPTAVAGSRQAAAPRSPGLAESAEMQKPAVLRPAKGVAPDPGSDGSPPDLSSIPPVEAG